METKTLKLVGSPGKIENHYSFTLEVPSKLDLLSLIERPPFQILSKDETTFTSGVLAHVPHSIKVRIARDYQDPFIGIFIKLSPKSDELVQVIDIKGAFALPDSFSLRSRTGSISSTSASKTLGSRVSTDPSPSSNPTNTNPTAYNNGNHFNQNGFGSSGALQGNLNINHYNMNHYDHNYQNHYDPIYDNLYPNYLNNNNGNPNTNEEGHQEFTAQQKRALFSFFKNSVTKVPELDHYDYYESRCHWPDVATKLCVFIRISKTNYSVIVNDDTPLLSSSTCTSMFDSEPFFMSESCSDVLIKVGSIIFPAHKIILSARSKYFARMFSNQMRETAEGIVQIDDVDEALMRQVLSFIYLGKIDDIDNTNAGDLLLLSDKYDIEDLGIYCELQLLNNLTIDNAIEMFDLSHTVGRRGILAKKSKEIIMWNKDKFAADLNTFKEFAVKYPDLIFELLKL